jgi:hypothetical protein
VVQFSNEIRLTFRLTETDTKEKREIEKKRKEMQWAAMASKELRNKSTGFIGGKKASEVIREYRDREK